MGRQLVVSTDWVSLSASVDLGAFNVGQLVLALYPDTTCFYRAFVYQPPSQEASPPLDCLLTTA